MKLCDRCVKNEANNRLELRSSEAVQNSWELCDTCFGFLCEEFAKAVEGYRPPELREFCPSLTPDQAKQVEQYIVSRSKS